MVNLHWRDIVPNANCALCKDHPEDSLHAVWACEVISGVEYVRLVPPIRAGTTELLQQFTLQVPILP